MIFFPFFPFSLWAKKGRIGASYGSQTFYSGRKSRSIGLCALESNTESQVSLIIKKSSSFLMVCLSLPENSRSSFGHEYLILRATKFYLKRKILNKVYAEFEDFFLKKSLSTFSMLEIQAVLTHPE